MHQVKQRARINAVKYDHRRTNSENGADSIDLESILQSKQNSPDNSPGRSSKKSGAKSPSSKTKVKVDKAPSILAQNIQPSIKLRLLVEQKLLEKMSRAETSVFSSLAMPTQQTKNSVLQSGSETKKHGWSENRSTVDTPGLKPSVLVEHGTVTQPKEKQIRELGTFQQQVREGSLDFQDLHSSMKASSKDKKAKQGLGRVLKDEIRFLNLYYAES